MWLGLPGEGALIYCVGYIILLIRKLPGRRDEGIYMTYLTLGPMRRSRLAGLLLLGVLATPAAAQFTGQRHPDWKRLEPAEQFDEIWSEGWTGKKSGALHSLSERLRKMRRQWRVGALQSPHAWEMFGRVQDVAIDRRGRVFVLDNEYATVRVFSAKGDFLFEVGRRGEGPGEFIYPEFLAIDSHDTLYVTDRRHGIHVFAPRDNHYQYVRTIILPRIASGGLCVSDTSIIISDRLSNRNKSLIYHIGKSGNIINQFGKGINYDTNNPLVLSYITRNYMACDWKHRMLIIAYRNAPIVQVYRMDGTLLKTIAIRDLELIGFIEMKSGGITFPRRRDKEAVLINVLRVAEGVFLIQYAIWQTKDFDRARPFAYLFDVVNNRKIFLNKLPVPRIMALHGNRLIASDYDDIPHISYYTY
ncbi:6-bladed beta-propeller [Rhodothermus profundi]|uniref:6-bladed beta-propeller n=1 Tax=Rhodothermus profundi TaxID=633813 RepID=A0A1M6QL75_9BACT|nr:6-bladed beta-propeller [Rhodothermus profundi]SHK20767.1 hypothetical protein SAMN04488087_0661 [Rhodothermus profundi]